MTKFEQAVKLYGKEKVEIGLDEGFNLDDIINGYIIMNEHEIGNAKSIQRIDVIEVFDGDESAARAAEKQGVEIMWDEVENLYSILGRYIFLIDHDENRQLLNKFYEERKFIRDINNTLYKFNKEIFEIKRGGQIYKLTSNELRELRELFYAMEGRNELDTLLFFDDNEENKETICSIMNNKRQCLELSEDIREVLYEESGDLIMDIVEDFVNKHSQKNNSSETLNQCYDVCPECGQESLEYTGREELDTEVRYHEWVCNNCNASGYAKYEMTFNEHVSEL